MKVPLSWLKDYVDFEDSVEGLAGKLTFSGAEVEGIETVGGDCEGVVAGEIIAVEKHPNADRLSVCRVTDGTDEFQVVCGAPNCKAGGKHPFAKAGAVLQGEFKIKKAKLRGIESFGMLCAEDELGISDNHDGIMELPADTPTGTPLSEVLGPPEIVFDLEITPNRPDCLSIMGIAREVAAIYGTKLKRPDTGFEEIEQPVGDLASVKIEDPHGCPRYTARALRDVEIGPAPDWMQKRLKLAGIRPINNIVDITNYVLLECGHPLHAFDHSLIADGRIVVRRAQAGEKIQTLDEEERELTAEMLVIADPQKPIAIAGVMGGAGSEISGETETVLLESAYFDPASIRHTSKELGLISESSYRFSRGTDCGGAEWASRRATALMQRHANATVLKGVIDQYPAPREEHEIVCRTEAIARLLGIEIATDELAETFSNLELNVLEQDSASCTVKVPSFRLDLKREVDLAEEYARLYGLDNIPESAPHAQIVPEASDKDDQAKSVCRANLVGLGMREIMNYSLVSPELLAAFGDEEKDRRISIPHPISSDQSVLRTSLIPQLVESLGRNNMRQLRSAAFFEMGRVFYEDSDGSQSEEDRVSIGIMGARGRTGFDRFKPAKPAEMFVWLKGIVSNLLEFQNIDEIAFKKSANRIMASGYSTAIEIDGTEIGVAGVVEPSIAEKWRIQEPIAVAELALDPIVEHVFDIRRYTPISTQPAVERDIALIADQSLKHEEIMSTIKSAAPAELEKVELFDIFTGKGIPSDKKSLAYALTYRAQDRTLTDEQANKYHDVIKAAIRKKLPVEIRE